MIVQQRFEIAIGLLTLSLTMIFLSMTSVLVARAEIASDFTSDVQQGLRAGTQNSAVASIKTEDYKTSWDEFGTNVLVDGAGIPTEIKKDLIEDIVNGLQTELSYNQRDEQYLRLRHSSPEEIQALEGDGSGDVLPENYFEPNPSLDANPDVNSSALDVKISVIDMSGVLATPALDVPPTPDILVPPAGEWKPADISVFETILNADNPPANVGNESSPNTPPPADASAN